MQQLALSWLTYRLTQSPFMLGVITFAGQGPSMILGPFAGVIPDLFNRHKLLIATQTLFMIQSILLAWLYMGGHIQVWQIIALGAFAGIVNAVDMPTRQAFVIDMTENKEDLPNVIALNSSLVNFTRLIGPALAGIVVAKWGENVCFIMNALSFLAVLAALLAMKIKSKVARPANLDVLGHLRDGFSYVARHNPIKFFLITTALTALSAVPYMVLMPVYVKTTFHGSAQLLGYMMAASAMGALLGTLTLAARKSVLGLGNWIIAALFTLAASLLLFSFSTNLILSLICLAAGGFGMMMQTASSNTILQTLVDDDKRGRVMSLFTMAFLGTVPFGGMLFGYIADHFGCAIVMRLCGALALGLAINTIINMPKLRKEVRPIYIRRGIIVEQST